MKRLIGTITFAFAAPFIVLGAIGAFTIWAICVGYTLMIANLEELMS